MKIISSNSGGEYAAYLLAVLLVTASGYLQARVHQTKEECLAFFGNKVAVMEVINNHGVFFEQMKQFTQYAQTADVTDILSYTFLAEGRPTSRQSLALFRKTTAAGLGKTACQGEYDLKATRIKQLFSYAVRGSTQKMEDNTQLMMENYGFKASKEGSVDYPPSDWYDFLQDTYCATTGCNLYKRGRYPQLETILSTYNQERGKTDFAYSEGRIRQAAFKVELLERSEHVKILIPDFYPYAANPSLLSLKRLVTLPANEDRPRQTTLMICPYDAPEKTAEVSVSPREFTQATTIAIIAYYVIVSGNLPNGSAN